MALTMVQTDNVRTDRIDRYQELVRELAQAAASKQEGWRWSAHQVAFGPAGIFHYTTRLADFAEVQQRGNVEELARRVLGDQRGAEILREANECILSNRSTISMERPDLSYPPEELERPAPAALVTVARALPGKQETCEELLRKLAEAIPKTDEPARIYSFQTVIGDPLVYWSVRPLESLDQLDEQLQPAALLDKAFGPAEGGLIFRSGLEAIERVQRSITLYREDLSNSQ